jgi:hypothetical protein
MKAELVTRAEIDENQTLINTVRASLDDHAERTFATAHLGPVVIDSNYIDSNGLAVVSTVLQVEIDGTTMYIPCRIVVGEVPAS